MMLPYNKEPFFTCCNYMSFPFNVIESNSKSDITEWIFGKAFCIRFDFTSVQNKFTFAVDDPCGINEGMIASQYVSLQKKMLIGVNIDIAVFFKKFINRGHYIHCGYSEKRANKVTDKDDYHSPDFLIYGYFDDGFYISGTRDGKSTGLFKIGASELSERIYTADDELLEFSLFKYNGSGSLQCLKEKSIKVLEEYISGDSVTLGNKHYGIDAVKALKNYVKSYEETECNFNVLLHYLMRFVEHKKLLLRFAKALFFDSESVECVSVFQKNFELAKSIEYKINNRLDGVIYMFDEIIENEVAFLPAFLDKLKNGNGEKSV